VGLSSEEALAQIDAVSPVLQEVRAKTSKAWQPDGPPLSVVMSEYARTFVENTHLFTTQQIQELFALMEDLLLDADDSVKDAVATGFFEGLLGRASAGSFDFQAVARFLGPTSQSYCQEWDKFTGLKTPGL
jgi:hypothetical protein